MSRLHNIPDQKQKPRLQVPNAPSEGVHAGIVRQSPVVSQLSAYGTMAKAGSVMQRQAAQNGLSLQLKSGIEHLSGVGMDDVRVHYNSSKPAQLQAHAYAQGAEIHLAPGQERHLPHEAWHVVQQKQGRVKPTLQLQGVAINDDSALEREADRMGGKAMTTGAASREIPKQHPAFKAACTQKMAITQRVVTSTYNDSKRYRQRRMYRGKPHGGRCRSCVSYRPRSRGQHLIR